VEHELVAQLAGGPSRKERDIVEFTYQPTGRNLPALEFITSIGAKHRDETGHVLDPSGGTPGQRGIRSGRQGADRREIPATVSPENRPPSRDRLPAPPTGPSACSGSASNCATPSGLQERSRNTGSASTSRCGGGRNFEQRAGTALRNIWRKVLGTPRIGLNDNFFRGGRKLLRAVQVIAMIQEWS